ASSAPSVSTIPTTASNATAGAWCCVGNSWSRSSARPPRGSACCSRAATKPKTSDGTTRGWDALRGTKTAALRRRYGLLHYPEERTLARRLRRLRWRAGRRRIVVMRLRAVRARDVVGQRHALAGLARIHRQHRGDRHVHRKTD